MKTSRIFQGLFTGLAMLAASPAIAEHKGLLHISSPMEIQNRLLPVGIYMVRWEDTGANVELRIMKGNETLETVPAVVTTLRDESDNDTVVINVRHDGRLSLSQILFAGRRLLFTLE